jgi:integrase
MPRYRSHKPHAPAVLSLAPIRAQVIADTGVPPGLLQRVQPHDLVLVGAACSVRVSARKKGGGVGARTIPLTTAGAIAFRAFHAAGAYGRFATSSLNRAFKHGCRAAGIDPRSVRLYDLRHSFLTDLYRATHDLATVARFALHAAGSPITARYAQGANREVDQAAALRLDAEWAAQRQAARQLAASSGALGPTILPANPARSRKSNVLRMIRK